MRDGRGQCYTFIWTREWVDSVSITPVFLPRLRRENPRSFNGKEFSFFPLIFRLVGSCHCSFSNHEIPIRTFFLHWNGRFSPISSICMYMRMGGWRRMWAAVKPRETILFSHSCLMAFMYIQCLLIYGWRIKRIGGKTSYVVQCIYVQ